MGRSRQTAGFSFNRLFGVLFLVMVVAGMPLLIQGARHAGAAVTALMND